MKNLLLLMFVLNFTIFGEINDRISLIDNEELKILDKKIKEIEKESDISFKIIISKKKENIENYSKILKKSVIIFILKNEKENTVNISLYFTKDINVIPYNEEIKTILENANTLVENQQYTDLLYELSGAIADIVNLINKDSKDLKNGKKYIYIYVMLLAIFAMILRFALIKKNKSRNPIVICRNCKIKMELKDEFVEDKRLVAIYGCNICGNSEKIFLR